MVSKMRWMMAVLFIAALSVSAASAQDDACLQRGGQLNDEGQCVLSLSMSIQMDYPLELAENDIVASTLDPFIETTRLSFVEAVSMAFSPAPGIYESIATYETTQYSDEITSLVYTIYEFTGGAHGNTYFHTFTFDLANGTLITLDDLFAEGSDPFAVIAPIVETLLTEQLGDAADPQWIVEGTGDNPDNYQNFSLSEDGITFYFPPYQVAFYAAGTQTVTIPFSELSAVLAPAFAG